MTYHWKHGWHFWRLEDGTVSVRQEVDGHIVVQAAIPPNEWASIMAAVSAAGENAQTYRLAEILHGNESLGNTPLGKLLAGLNLPGAERENGGTDGA